MSQKKQLISQDDINWSFNGQETEINYKTGDHRITDKAIHVGKKYKQGITYRSRFNNIETHKKHFEDELNWHASKRGWWEYDKDIPIKYSRNNYNLN